MKPPGLILSAAVLAVTATAFASFAALADEPKPLPSVPPGVKVLRDLPYVEHGHERQKLNLFLLEKKSDTPLPVIVVIHGGGWVAGERGGAARNAPSPSRRTRRRLVCIRRLSIAKFQSWTFAKRKSKLASAGWRLTKSTPHDPLLAESGSGPPQRAEATLCPRNG